MDSSDFGEFSLFPIETLSSLPQILSGIHYPQCHGTEHILMNNSILMGKFFSAEIHIAFKNGIFRKMSPRGPS